MTASTVLVLGGGDVGSAVAHRLYVLGANVVLHDTEGPAHPRRGMAFTDAWFDGTSALDGVVARLGRSVESLRHVLRDVQSVAATALPVQTLVGEFTFDAVVDARMRKRSVPEDLRALAPVTLGLGPAFTPGVNCHLAIETAWGEALGHVLDHRGARALAEPRALGGAGRERFVYARHAGLWQTGARIAQAVPAGALVGTLDGRPVHAPLAGTVRGLSHDGLRVQARQKIVEIDPRARPQVEGLGERPMATACAGSSTTRRSSCR